MLESKRRTVIRLKLPNMLPYPRDALVQEKGKIGLISKTTSLHTHHAFLYISLPLLSDNDVKMPNFTFYGGRTQATTKFSFSFQT